MTSAQIRLWNCELVNEHLPSLSELCDCCFVTLNHLTMGKILQFSECACVGGRQNTATSEPESSCKSADWLAACGLVEWGMPDNLPNDFCSYSCASRLPGHCTTCTNFRHWMWKPNAHRNVTFVTRCCCFLYCMASHQLWHSSWRQGVLIELMLWSNYVSWCVVHGWCTVCMYACMCVCMHAHLCACMNMCVWACVCMHVCVHVCICMWVGEGMGVDVGVHACALVHIYLELNFDHILLSMDAAQHKQFSISTNVTSTLLGCHLIYANNVQYLVADISWQNKFVLIQWNIYAHLVINKQHGSVHAFHWFRRINIGFDHIPSTNEQHYPFVHAQVYHPPAPASSTTLGT